MRSKTQPKTGQDEVCVPIEDREPNKVDVLNLQIQRIKESCGHDFRLIKRPELQTLPLRPSIIVGNLEGPAEVDSSETAMVLVCLHCSEEKMANIETTCPHCLSPMKKGSICGDRKEYFGCKHLYFRVSFSYCPNCKLTVASDEWCQ